MNEQHLKSFEERIQDLISVSERLIKILNEENKALRENKPHVIHHLFEEKDRLCRAYEILVKRVGDKKEFAAHSDENTKEELRTLGKELEEMMDENSRLLRIAIDSGKRFMKRVSSIAKERSVHTPTYSGNGRVNGNQPGPGVAITYNQNF